MNNYRLTPVSCAVTALIVLLGAVAGPAAYAGEVLFHDGQREMAMVDAVTPAGKLRVLSASGEAREVGVEDIVYVQFWGRRPRNIHSGTQEAHLVSGDHIRGRIMKLDNDDILHLDSFAVGHIQLPMRYLHGLLTLPVQGAAGRRAEELLSEKEEAEGNRFIDRFLDRRSASYDGVIENLNPDFLDIDDEQLMRTTQLKILYLAGIRLAKDTKEPRPPLPDTVFIRVLTRDGGTVDGFLRKIEFGLWKLQPLWDAKKVVPLRIDEIVYVEVLNGRTLYLSQLEPATVKEKTMLAPAQPYRRNRNCRGDTIALGGNHYAWGVGVHADSELTYDIAGRFKTLKATVGIDDKVGDQGSVVFKVLSGTKVLAVTPTLRGSDEAPHELSVPVAGVRKLTLKVEPTGDMDLGDVANWANVRLVR